MTGMRFLLLLASLLAAGCGDDGTTTINCGTGTTGGLTPGAKVEVTAEAGKDLRGAAIKAGAKTTAPSGEVSIECAADIVPEGFVALGPAVKLGPEGAWSDRPFEVTLPYKAARLPKGAENRHVRIVALRDGQPAYFPAVSNRHLDDDDRYASTATFRAGELTTYQVVAATDAGTPETQEFQWRAIVGISMGGNAAMSIGLRNPDKFDIVVDLVGEPGPSMVYSLGMVRDFLFGGFCTAADQAAGRGNIGTLCPNASTKQDQFEITADFEHMISQSGDGVGLTLRRGLYMKASRDLARALSNPGLYNPAHPYLPPGVDLAYINQPAATRCANPRVLDDFFDAEFNPAGTSPVITFCDGGDAPGMLGVFDPAQPQTDPAELLLAVDLNNNGRRDAGEPVVTNAMETFLDVGLDGKASKDEPGYNALTNRDPSRDDYHYLRNPLGAEGNSDFNPGEPYDDFGLDGVQGTCQIGTPPPGGVAGCYDFGEGNGKWDLSPNVARWYESDVMLRTSKLSDAQRRHMSLWFDAGIRDFLNASVSANAGVGQLMAKYQLPFAVHDGFATMTDSTSESAYDFIDIDWTAMPQHNYLRYGNPDASAAEISAGDGRHVGTPQQIINRATTAFAWLDKRWPEGDRSDTLALGVFKRTEIHTSPTTGRMSPYAIFLPPGYEDNPDARYPVVYFLHGYGQEPADLIDLSAIFANYMIKDQALASRFQKFIIVYVDGRCRPQIDGVPVDPSGDRCEGGTFYMDAPGGGPAQMESNMLELMAHIDATYRTKAPSSARVTP